MPRCAVRCALPCSEVLNIIPVSHGVCSGVPGAAVGLPAAGDSAKVGYVRVITFNANTTLAVAQAVKEIKVSELRSTGDAARRSQERCVSGTA